MLAALELFADHGVNGTSLQMIANTLGVTKAAVYHQFKTKDEIIIAVTEMQLARLEDALEDAEAADDRPQARESLLNRVIEMAVDQRRGPGRRLAAVSPAAVDAAPGRPTCVSQATKRRMVAQLNVASRWLI
jgi:AcrR family transcriptional regulator